MTVDATANPSVGQSRAGFIIFFLSAFMVAFVFGCREAGIDPMNATGPEVVAKGGTGAFFAIIGKALACGFSCGYAGAWGFTLPRLWTMGVLCGLVSTLVGQVVYGSIFNFFWSTVCGPVLLLESLLCMGLALLMTFLVLAKQDEETRRAGQGGEGGQGI